MRAFVSLEVQGSAADSLMEFERELEATGADLKLVERENLHLNLKFLGEIDDAQAAEVRSRLGTLSLKGAEVAIRGAGAFPNPGRPRVVWAGVAREHEVLVAPIAQRVVGLLAGIGAEDDRPFRAHVTLGRVRTIGNVKRLADLLLQSSAREFGTIRLEEVKFKSSVLTASGPVYRDMGAYRLA